MSDNLDNNANDWMKIFTSGQSDLNSKEKLIPSVVALVVVFASILIVRPLFLNILDERSELKKRENVLEKLEKEESILKRLNTKEELDLLGERLDYMEKYVPNIKPSLQTLIHISRLSRLKDIKFSGMTLNPGVVKSESLGSRSAKSKSKSSKRDINKLSSFEVEFSIVGQKDDLLDYVTKLNEISPLMKVEHFTTSIVDTTSDDTKKGSKTQVKKTTFDEKTYLKASLTLSVFYLPVEEDLPKVKDIESLLLTESEQDFLNEIENYLFMDPRFANADDLLIEAPLGKPNPFMETVEKTLMKDRGTSVETLVVSEASGSATTK